MKSNQNYISHELTHFVGRSLENDEARYTLLIEIVKSGLLRGKVDNGKGSTMVQVDPNIDFSSNDSYNPNIVCFCDIPVSDFDIHMCKYSHFGLAFFKDFLIQQGVRPVFYIPLNTKYVNESLTDMFNKNARMFHGLFQNETMSFISQIQNSIENKLPFPQSYMMDYHQFFSMQLLSFIKFFDPQKQDEDPNNFYMEREWRSLERIEFGTLDIKRIILPSSYITRFFKDIPEYNGHITTVDA